MKIDNHGHEHEFEPQHGLPERLPLDERIVWQVSPDVAALAKDAFHFRTLIFYFAVLWVACVAPELSAGSSMIQVLISLKWLAPLTVLCLASVWALAWMTARTTVYTLTNKRLVMRLGIVLTVTFNLPLTRIASADLRKRASHFGDIALELAGDDHIAWVHLWPSVRPWRIARPQPMVRSVPQAAALASQLSEVWVAQTGIAAQPLAQNARTDSAPVSPRLQASLT